MSGLDDIRNSPEHTLLYFLEDPVVVVSRKGKVVYLNPAFRIRFNASREKSTGAALSRILPPWMWETIVGRLGTMAPDEAPQNFWLRNETERFRVSMAGITLDDKLAGAVVTLWDAAREYELKRQNLELFHAMLEDVSAPLDEIKTLLKSGGGKAANHVDHMAEGFSRFRDFAELLFGEIHTERSPFYPGRLISLARKSLRPLADQRNVYLEEGGARELPKVLGDPALLNRVLGLLLDYQIRVVPPDEIVVAAAEILTTGEGTTWLCYSVTGTGFLSQETSLLERKQKGISIFTGLPDAKKRMILGLFLARRLVSAMGGIISVAANELAGTTISLRVPVEVHPLV